MTRAGGPRHNSNPFPLGTERHDSALVLKEVTRCTLQRERDSVKRFPPSPANTGSAPHKTGYKATVGTERSGVTHVVQCGPKGERSE